MTTATPNDTLLSTLDAAEILDVTRQHVSRICKAGQLPGAKQLGRTWVIPKSSIDAYLNR